MGSEEKRENKENVERNKYNWSENGESLDPNFHKKSPPRKRKKQQGVFIRLL